MLLVAGPRIGFVPGEYGTGYGSLEGKALLKQTLHLDLLMVVGFYLDLMLELVRMLPLVLLMKLDQQGPIDSKALGQQPQFTLLLLALMPPP